MAITAREAFEKGTITFNAHDIAGFAEAFAKKVAERITTRRSR